MVSDFDGGGFDGGDGGGIDLGGDSYDVSTDSGLDSDDSSMDVSFDFDGGEADFGGDIADVSLDVDDSGLDWGSSEIEVSMDINDGAVDMVEGVTYDIQSDSADSYSDFSPELETKTDFSTEIMDSVSLDTETEAYLAEVDESVSLDTDIDVGLDTPDPVSDLIVEDIQSDIAAIQADMEADAAAVEDIFVEQTDAPYEITNGITPNESPIDVAQDSAGIENIQGWLGDINPNYDPFDLDSAFDNNCGSCAFAVEQRLDGDANIVATEKNIDTASEMNEITGMKQVSMSPDEIKEHLISQGPGSHGIVGIDRAEGPGHWFNAYYDGEQVIAIDGQTGTVQDWPPDYGDITNWDISVREE